MKYYMINSVQYSSLLILLFISLSCSSQTEKTKKPVPREAVFAGQFYPAQKQALEVTLRSFFENAIKKQGDNETLAILSPHAGYVYSGQVAASSYSQINADKAYEHIFILAPSHRVSFNGVSIYNTGNYITPLGQVEVDKELATELIEKHPEFIFHPQAHAQEHSLEVQLPFLQYCMKKPYKIVPMVFGTQKKSTIQKVAKILVPYLNSKNLFIVSTDFSHYPAYEYAKKYDSLTAEAIVSKSPQRFDKIRLENVSHNTPQMHTSLCGWPNTLCMIYMVEPREDITARKIQYWNSGDIRGGDKSRVVGYWSISFVKGKESEAQSFNINDDEKKYLLKLARETISSYTLDHTIPEVEKNDVPKKLLNPMGAFVTLHKNHSLRGCIGRFYSEEPLYKVVQQMAVSAAMNDPRFNAVKAKEVESLKIEISVLTPLKKINSIDEIQLGKHGIYIKKGYQSGTFLPQVATETGWGLEELLGHCSADKAGLGWEGWKEADLFIYEAIVFSEKDFGEMTR